MIKMLEISKKVREQLKRLERESLRRVILDAEKVENFIKFSKNQDYDIVMVTKLSSIIKEYPYFGEING